MLKVLDLYISHLAENECFVACQKEGKKFEMSGEAGKAATTKKINGDSKSRFMDYLEIMNRRCRGGDCLHQFWTQSI